MDKRGKLLRDGLAWEQNDFAVADTEGRGDAFAEFQLDSLPDDEIHEAFAALSNVAGDRSCSACKESRSDQAGDELVPTIEKRVDTDRPSHGKGNSLIDANRLGCSRKRS
jgi:hypothetical protein